MKNKFMRLAAVMLMLCLVTTCAISGTFAKYTTEVSGEDTARVAYWGFTGTDTTDTIEIKDLFNKSYENDNGVVSNSNDVIAPGTTNSATFKFSYTTNTTSNVTKPEVAYSFTVDTTGSAIGDSIKANQNIQWRLGVTEGTDDISYIGASDTNSEAWGTWDQLIDNILALSGATGIATDAEKATANYSPNTLPEAFDNNQVYTIEWRWNFETAADADTANKNEMNEQDATDTAMGNASTLETVVIKIKITATQLDTIPETTT